MNKNHYLINVIMVLLNVISTFKSTLHYYNLITSSSTKGCWIVTGHYPKIIDRQYSLSADFSTAEQLWRLSVLQLGRDSPHSKFIKLGLFLLLIT